VLDTIRIDGGIDPNRARVTIGFGSIWVARPLTTGGTEILRVSPLSGRARSFRVAGDLADIRATPQDAPDGVWAGRPS
jgi:hypothetical protein